MTQPTIARGLEGVYVAESRLSRVDGLNGELIIGGYDVQELAGKASFEEVAHLLWRGNLPTRSELDELNAQLVAARSLPYEVLSLIDALAGKKGMEPMAVLRTAISACALDDPDPQDRSPEAEYRRSMSITARIPTVVAAYHRLRTGHRPIPPRADLSHAANFLWMFNGEAPAPVEVEALDAYLVCLSDHGMNASTFTSRTVVSTQSDVYSAIVAAIGSLKGVLHGGAPSAVLEMFRAVGSAERAEGWVRAEMEAGRRIMGIGHRVYKVRDPRAKILAEMSERVADQTGHRATYDLAREVERVAVAVLEELKPGRNLYANVEFYTATLHDLLGIPGDLFSSMFAMSRVSGWTAHVMAQLADNRLIRPKAHYVGQTGLKFVPIDRR
ncbi:MAG: citrate/2-methylcitrate synthase [Anaerolineae bacterium]